MYKVIIARKDNVTTITMIIIAVTIITCITIITIIINIMLIIIANIVPRSETHTASHRPLTNNQRSLCNGITYIQDGHTVRIDEGNIAEVRNTMMVK